MIDGVLALLLPACCGWLVVNLATGRARWPEEIAKAIVGLGIGVALSGATTFLGLLLFDRVTVVFEAVLLIGLLVATHRFGAEPLSPPAKEQLPKTLVLWLGLATMLVLAFGAAVWTSRTWHEPHGAWDAWDFWNMRARWYFRAGADWSRTHSEVPLWTHPSYPPMLPAAIARGFAWLGGESAYVPQAYALVFTSAPVALLAWTLWRARGAAQGWIGALTLVATPYFVVHGADQYADAPLAFLFAATVAFTTLYDESRRPRLLVLAGLCATLAALTKNEGSLFVVAFVTARSFVAARGGRERWRAEGLTFAAGAVWVGLLVATFKLGFSVMPSTGEFYVGPQPGWNHGPIEHVIIQVSTADRWVGVAESWWLHATTFDLFWPFPLIPGLLVYGLVMGRSARRPRDAVYTIFGLIGLSAFVVTAMFLAWSTYPIREHMDALQRLLYQWMPSMMLGFFLYVRTPGEEDP